MPFRKLLVVSSIFLTVFVASAKMLLNNVREEEIPFENYKPESNVEIIAKYRVPEAKQFFNLFNVQYLICFFAAKGKWPIIPPIMQIKVDSVSRTIFSRNDNFIRTYCGRYFTVIECHRPDEYLVTAPQPPPTTMMTTTTINTEVETFDPEPEEPDEPQTTPCTCGSRKLVPTHILFYDKNQVGNVSSETILNTIEFLKSFLSAEPKRKKKTKVRING